MLFAGPGDLMLDPKGKLCVGNHGRQEQGMGFAAYGALHAADAKPKGPLGGADRAVVVAMDGQTSSVTARACKLVQLDAVYNRIIKNLRKSIAILDENRYHNLVLNAVPVLQTPGT